MAIRWKVVTEDRESWSYFVLPKKLLTIYKKGARLKTVDGSLGFLTFRTKKQAIEFAETHNISKAYKIIKLNAIGRGKRISKVVATYHFDCTTSLQEIMAMLRRMPLHRVNAPPGTIAYKEVEVLS